MKTFKLIVLWIGMAVLAMFGAGCANTHQNRAAGIGAGIGAVTGGILGGVVGHNSGRKTAEGVGIGAAVGAGIGALAGGNIGARKDIAEAQEGYGTREARSRRIYDNPAPARPAAPRQGAEGSSGWERQTTERYEEKVQRRW